MTCTSYSQAFFVNSPRVFSSANCASSLASAMQPGRRPSPSEFDTSYFLYERFDDITRIMKKYDVSYSLGDGLRIRHIVLLHDPGNVIEPLVEEVLLMMVGHPLGHDGAATTHNAGDALG